MDLTGQTLNMMGGAAPTENDPMGDVQKATDILAGVLPMLEKAQQKSVQNAINILENEVLPVEGPAPSQESA